MTEEESEKYFRKDVKLITTDGHRFNGRCVDVTSAYDNDPDEASITLDIGISTSLTEIYLSEIESIEIIDKN